MTESAAITEELNLRFYNLIFSLERAQDIAGVEVEGKVKAEQSEQFNARRQLLRVEKIAQRDKELNERSKENFIDGVRKQVHDAVEQRMEETFADIEHVFRNIVGIDQGLAEVLDMLVIKAASVARLEPLVEAVPWLHTDILRMVNTPKYRKTDRLGKAITVESLRMAMSFLGLENMKLLIPSMALKRWTPQITDPYPSVKTRLWEHALGTALSCQKIAQVSKADPIQAYILGMFHEVGKLAIVRSYFKTFEEVHKEALIESHKEKRRDEHEALNKIEPSADFAIVMMQKHSANLSAKLIEHMGMKRVFIVPALEEYAQGMPIKQMCPMARVLMQGNAYSLYRLLKANKLLNMDEAKVYLRQFYMPQGALALLKTTDLRRLNLSFEEE